MPLYDNKQLDIPVGPGYEFATIEEAMIIRERPNVPRSEDADYGSQDISDEEIEKLLRIHKGSEVCDFGQYDISDEEIDILIVISEIKAFVDEPFTVEYIEDIERHLKWITEIIEQHEENFGPDKERTPEEEA